MVKKNNYDPVKTMYDALGSDDITLEYAFMLYGSVREAIRVMKHGFSDGYLEMYEYLGPVQRYLDAWELDELARNLGTEKGDQKIKEVFLSATKKGKKKY